MKNKEKPKRRRVNFNTKKVFSNSLSIEFESCTVYPSKEKDIIDFYLDKKDKIPYITVANKKNNDDFTEKSVVGLSLGGKTFWRQIISCNISFNSFPMNAFQSYDSFSKYFENPIVKLEINKS